jgi:hypothetical protein
MIRVDGTYRTVWDSPAPNRGDMSYWGFALADIIPPMGFLVELNEDGEPVFIRNDRRIGGHHDT